MGRNIRSTATGSKMTRIKSKMLGRSTWLRKTECSNTDMCEGEIKNIKKSGKREPRKKQVTTKSVLFIESIKTGN